MKICNWKKIITDYGKIDKIFSKDYSEYIQPELFTKQQHQLLKSA